MVQKKPRVDVRNQKSANGPGDTNPKLLVSGYGKVVQHSFRLVAQLEDVSNLLDELFTFRVWLVRLGLNGSEFKNTRDHLLANLDGDRAWRYDKDSYDVNKKKKKNRETER